MTRRFLERRQVASRLGLTPFEFTEVLPTLVRDGFPEPDPITRYFPEDLVDAWVATAAVQCPQIEAKKTERERCDDVRRRLNAEGFFPLTDSGASDFVYFIGGGGRVKIGRAADPFKRLKHLQIGSPFRLELICVVPNVTSLENYLHQKFSPEHSHREWFELSERLKSYIRFADRVGYAPVAKLHTTEGLGKA